MSENVVQAGTYVEYTEESLKVYQAGIYVEYEEDDIIFETVIVPQGIGILLQNVPIITLTKR